MFIDVARLAPSTTATQSNPFAEFSLKLSPMNPNASGDNFTETDALRILNQDFATFDTAAKGGKADNKVSLDDLRAVANNQVASNQVVNYQNASSDDRAAASYLLTHQDVLESLDTAAKGGKPDGIISKKDATILAIENWGNTNNYHTNIQDNVNIARGADLHIDPLKFYNLVKTNGKWDYKNQDAMTSGTAGSDEKHYNVMGPGGFSQADLAWFGNYNFGIVSRAYGLSLTTTLAGAGIANVTSQDGGNWFGALVGGAYAGNQFLSFPLGPLLDLGAAGLTNLGFDWGDNSDDSKAIKDGWNSGWA